MLSASIKNSWLWITSSVPRSYHSNNFLKIHPQPFEKSRSQLERKNNGGENAYHINQKFDGWKVSRKPEHLLDFHHRLSTTAIKTKPAILLNLVQALIHTFHISIADNQQLLLHGISLVTIQLQQMKLNVTEADVTRILSTNTQIWAMDKKTYKYNRFYSHFPRFLRWLEVPNRTKETFEECCSDICRC